MSSMARCGEISPCDDEPVAAAAAEIVEAAISRRKATVVVPNVIGRSWVEARDLLIAHQLVGGLDPSSPLSSVLDQPGTVIDQSPESGARVAPGPMVTLWLRPDDGGSAAYASPAVPGPRRRRAVRSNTTPSEEAVGYAAGRSARSAAGAGHFGSDQVEWRTAAGLPARNGGQRGRLLQRVRRIVPDADR